jgi:restriction endonuclease Mrr
VLVSIGAPSVPTAPPHRRTARRPNLDRSNGVQATRYAADNTVGREAIQAFVGALHGRNVTNGIFIPTSRFSPGAIAYADSIGSRIILIDGARFARLTLGVQSVTSRYP